MNIANSNYLREGELILSIETAVEGGSLSILANQTEIDGWIGTQEISKAEDVLEQISNLLKKNNINKEQIKVISVSRGAGSLTGEKIGLAIARGLAKSFNCRLAEISVFESLLMELRAETRGIYLTAVPSSKNHVQWQIFSPDNDFSHKKNSNPQISDKEEFAEKIKKIDVQKVFLSSGFHNFYDKSVYRYTKSDIAISSHSLAKLNGLATFKCVR